MTISKAENIRVEWLNKEEARKLLIKTAHEHGWPWHYDDKDRLVIDVSATFKKGDDDDDA